MLPEHFHPLAKALANKAGDDLSSPSGAAEYRSAISRAYYAAFNVADKFLRQLGFPKPKGDHHRFVHQRLLVCGDPEISRVGSDLADLHTRRNRADYYMDDKNQEKQANALLVVAEAARVIQSIQECPVNSDRWKEIQLAIARTPWAKPS